MCIRDRNYIMKNILLLAFLVLGAVSAKDRLKYTCDTKINTSLPCVLLEGNEMKLRLCPDDMVCPIPKDPKEPTKCIPLDSYAHLYAGEHCNTTSQCLNDLVCKREYCRLRHPANKSCVTDDSCDVESFCKETTENGRTKKECEDAGKKGEECSVTEKCRTNSMCIDGKCAIIGALKDGDAAKNESQCRSLYMHEGKCIKGPKFKREEKSNGEKKCIYEVNGEEFTKECEYVASEGENCLCPKGIGDIDTGSIADYFQSDFRLKCHLNKGPFCITADLIDMRKSFLSAFIAYTEMKDVSVQFTTSECVKRMYHRSYWEAKRSLGQRTDKFGFYLFLVISGIVVVASVIMLTIYFLKRRKKPEREEIEESMQP
eukprot:TRINITY_DN6607_c0_g1_i10.p1 TRINITY_DN6607_c0_g1~~TRINITY_DN6607_c0_g1_i10.p1  ORF type:complete len:372 (-),score=99.29 TRINITY_DN6607_c0_g1_i10:146-1261(-)